MPEAIAEKIEIAQALYQLRFIYNSSTIYAGIAQLIERFLAKEEARSLSLLARTKENASPCVGHFLCSEPGGANSSLKGEFGRPSHAQELAPSMAAAVHCLLARTNTSLSEGILSAFAMLSA